MSKITIQFATDFVKARLDEQIKDKTGDYILFYEKREKQDGDSETPYNLCLYEQKEWYIVSESSLQEILEFIDSKNKKRNRKIQRIDVDEVNKNIK